jgi:single-strand DNA-binding protein
MNRVTLYGNLTRDVELRPVGEQNVGSFSIAINRRWKTPQGEQREETTFVDCEAWGKLADTIAQWYGKGRGILVEGRLKLDTWDDKKTGEKRSRLKVVVEGFTFTGTKPDAQGNGGQAQAAPVNAGAQPDFKAGVRGKAAPATFSDDDIPF